MMSRKGCKWGMNREEYLLIALVVITIIGVLRYAGARLICNEIRSTHDADAKEKMAS